MELPNWNNTNYPLALKNQLDMLNYTDDIAKQLRLSQFIPKEFYTRTNTRGMLVAHAMGQGKTRLAVAIAHHFSMKEPDRQVVVLLPKSLEGNFRQNILDYSKHSGDNYKFISLNSSIMFKKMANADKSEAELAYEKRLGDFMNDVIKKNSLNDSLLIIDEAHNLFNAITNGAKNALALYDLIMKAKNLRLIFLTGTPIVNDPFELVPCFNMLKGTMQGNKLFSESRVEFEEFFIDRKAKSIKNKDKFTNRIYGLTSYYGDLYFDEESKKDFPKKLKTIVEKVPMSQTQFSRYFSAREKELEEDKKGYKAAGARFSASAGGSSTYRVKTRQISNYCIPEYALGPVRGRKAREKFIDKIKSEDLKNTHEYSPKMDKILHNIEKKGKTLGMVYSQFVSGEGLAVFARVLEVNGWTNYSNDKERDFDIKNKKKKTFAILSGSISPEERVELIKTFNQKENAHGANIRLLLLSGAVAEGIDLKRIRHVHVMEPFWNYARINQVETRAIRYKSHIDLPKAEQNVQVYVYLSTYPVGYPKKKITENTTDVELFKKSVNNMQIINHFLLAIAESSIDCNIHHKNLPKLIKKRIKCKLCSPTDVPLIHPLINKDMTTPNPCEEYQETKVKVKMIELDGEKFYYKKDGDEIIIYSFDNALNGYTEMPRSHPAYGDVYEQVI